ncbi:MAG: hypothetical protein LBB81_10330 [Treponema sp.]|nr:hypothetical protein [Treponema sp.]
MKKYIKIFPVILSMLNITHNVSTQDADFMRIRTEISPSNPVVNNPFTFSIYADHDTPDEISVLPPVITDILTIDRFVKASRLINNRVWTLVEYRFTAKLPGRYTLDPFTVVSPAGVGETNKVILNIQSNETGKIIVPKITWEGAPAQMRAGERAIISLRVHGWDSPAQGGEFFIYDVPEDVIMEAVPDTQRSGGIAVKFLLVPLEAKNVNLRAKILQFENTRFEIPALRINVINAVNPDRKEPAELSIADGQPGNFPAFEIHEDKQFFLNKRYRMQYEQLYAEALGLWEKKLYAQSLSEMRHFEREHIAGKYLRPIRREVEEILGINGMLDEKRTIYQIYLTLIITFFIFVIISPLGCFIILKGPVRKKAVVCCVALCLIAELFFISRMMDDKPPLKDKYKSGISLGVNLRRIADTEAEELLFLKEGYPVIIMQKSGSWLHIRTNDSDSTAGWVSDEKIIKY